MKTKSLFFAGILLLIFLGSVNSQGVAVKTTDVQQGGINITCTPDLYDLTSLWVREYGLLNPDTRLSVNKLPYNNPDLGIGENISIVSNKSIAAIGNTANWKMAVGRDIIVPILNVSNPFMTEILRKGVSSETLAQIFLYSEKQNWGNLLNGEQKAPVHIYIVSDESDQAKVAKFLQITKIPDIGITVGSNDAVLAAVQKDPYAIGFCKVVNVMGTDNQGLAANLRLLPIDKNGNGIIDQIEDIYGDVNVLLRGVWIGKYPKSLYSTIYAVSSTQPTTNTEVAFLSWILTAGQQYMNTNGFCDLAVSERQSQLNKINPVIVSAPTTTDSSNLAGWVLLILAFVITSGLIINAVARGYKHQDSVTPDFNLSATGFDENSVLVPQGLYFDKTHTWAFMEKDGKVTIGIDDFLQHITGPITRVEMKALGERINKGDLLFSVIQSGKQLNLYAPVSGIITKQNKELIANSTYINSSPYSEGWVYMFEPSNWIKEIQFLDMAEKYKKWINTEFSRVKDFLASTLKPESLEYSHVVLQDGGVLKDGVLADFGPEVWDDFQTNFLDTYK